MVKIREIGMGKMRDLYGEKEEFSLVTWQVPRGTDANSRVHGRDR